MRQSGRALLLRSSFLFASRAETLSHDLPRPAAARGAGPDKSIFGELFVPFFDRVIIFANFLMCADVGAMKTRPKVVIVASPKELTSFPQEELLKKFCL